MTNSYGKMRKKLQRTKELPGQISGAQLQIMVSATIFRVYASIRQNSEKTANGQIILKQVVFGST